MSAFYQTRHSFQLIFRQIDVFMHGFSEKRMLLSAIAQRKYIQTRKEILFPHEDGKIINEKCLCVVTTAHTVI